MESGQRRLVCELAECVQSSVSGEERLKRRRRVQNLDAQIVRVMKRAHPLKRYTLEEIYGLVDALDYEHLRRTLQSLLNREFLTFCKSDATYGYLP